MNCKEARRMLNCLMDGEDQPRAADALEHVESCASCREWHAGMERAIGLMTALRDATPEADIAFAVMVRLPARHPASVRGTARLPVWRPALKWIAASWLVGFVMLVLIGVTALNRVAQTSAATVVVETYHGTRAAADSLGDVTSTVAAVIMAFSRIMDSSVSAGGVLLSTVGVRALMLDAAILASLLLIWTLGRRAVARHSVLV